MRDKPIELGWLTHARRRQSRYDNQQAILFPVLFEGRTADRIYLLSAWRSFFGHCYQLFGHQPTAVNWRRLGRIQRRVRFPSLALKIGRIHIDSAVGVERVRTGGSAILPKRVFLRFRSRNVQIEQSSRRALTGRVIRFHTRRAHWRQASPNHPAWKKRRRFQRTKPPSRFAKYSLLSA